MRKGGKIITVDLTDLEYDALYLCVDEARMRALVSGAKSAAAGRARDKLSEQWRKKP